MYELDSCPTVAVRGGRGWKGDGCRRPHAPGSTVKLFPGALRALQNCTFKRFCLGGDASSCCGSSEEPSYSSACLDILEILPGVKMREAFTFFAIGRTGELSSDKHARCQDSQGEAGLTAKCCFSAIVIGVTTWIKSIERTSPWR